MPTTVDASARNSRYTAGNDGFSARSLFQYRGYLAQLVYSGATSAVGNIASQTAVAQSFTTTSAVTISEVRASINKQGTPADNLSLEIRSDTGSNLPSSTIIATATNLFAGGGLSTVGGWVSFIFTTVVDLSANTKYWLVFQRSGALDASNYFQIGHSTASSYASNGRSFNDTGTWQAESATVDLCFQVLTERPSALYHVTQDTSLHIWKSTDWGASWSEQDSANKPTVTNESYPFDACATISGPYIGVGYFTATNTNACRYFNMSTDTWTTSDWGTTPPTATSNQRPIRVTITNTRTTISPGGFFLHYTSSADDADLHLARAGTSGAAWTVGTAVLALTSTEKSTYADVIMDKSPSQGFQQRFYYDVTNDDLSYRSMNQTTQGTEGDIDTSAADVDTEHASATYEIYQSDSAVDTAVIAFIDADGTLEEVIATLELATPTFASQNQISSDTGALGRQLSTCRYRGRNYVVACDGTNLDYHYSDSAASWTNVLTWLTGTSNAVTLSQAMSVPGVGVLVAYTDNGDAKVEWLKREKAPPLPPRTPRNVALRM